MHYYHSQCLPFSYSCILPPISPITPYSKLRDSFSMINIVTCIYTCICMCVCTKHNKSCWVCICFYLYMVSEQTNLHWTTNKRVHPCEKLILLSHEVLTAHNSQSIRVAPWSFPPSKVTCLLILSLSRSCLCNHFKDWLFNSKVPDILAFTVCVPYLIQEK